MSNTKLNIRPANRTDCPALIGLKGELAVHQNMKEKPMLKVEDIEIDGFDSTPPAFHAIVAESSESQEVVGFALYFFAYSATTGKILHLEDFCVTQNIRKSGIGSALFQELTEISIKEQCSLIQLEVLDWNVAGLNFYRKHDGVNMTSGDGGRHIFRFGKEDIHKLANLQE